MHIFLLILKIIGIVLLSVLGLAILVLLLVLFVPIRYKAMVCGEPKPEGNEIKAAVRIHWLLSLVSVRYGYPDNKVVLRVFGIPIKKIGNATDDTKKTEKPKKDKKTKPEKKQAKKSEDKEKGSKVKGAISKIKGFYSLLKAEENKEPLRFAKRIIFSLLKHIAPKKIVGDITIGTGDPCNTGLLFGGLGMFLSVIPEKCKIRPDFEEKKLEGYVKMKGRIYSVYLLYLGIKVIRNKDLKRIKNKLSAI